MAYRNYKKGLSFARNMDVVANRIAPRLNVRKLRFLALKGAFAKTNNLGR